MKNYWQNAITFDEYLKVAEDRFHNNPNKEDEYQEYYVVTKSEYFNK